VYVTKTVIGYVRVGREMCKFGNICKVRVKRGRKARSLLTAIIYYTCIKWNYDVNEFNASNLSSDRRKEVGV